MPTDSTFKTLTIITVVLVIAIIGVAYALVTPQWNNYSAVKSQLSFAQSKKADAIKAQSILDQFVESFNQHQSDVQKIKLALPAKTPDLANFVSMIGDVAKTNGVLLSNFSVSDSADAVEKAPPDNSIQILNINFSATGSYPAFKSLILHLENNLRVIDLGHITLKQDQTDILTYQVSLQTYYQK